MIDGALTSRRIAQALSGTLPEVSRAAVSSNRLRRGNVLLVEDNRVNQQVAAGLLARMISVAIASNGRQALEFIAAGEFDLVLMDMQMPVMDGLEATRRIRASGGAAGKVPIVGLTANAFASDRQACLDAGMDGFLAKPVSRQKLEGIADRWLSKAVPDEGPPPTAVAAASGSGADHQPQQRRSTDVAALVDTIQQSMLRNEIGEEMLDTLMTAFWSDAQAIIRELEDPAAPVPRPSSEPCTP